MEVSIMYATPHPIETMSLAAGVSYGKDNVSMSRVVNCLKHRHMSVAEFGDIQFKIEGISRNCSHQLVRHRLCSFLQESQRYNKYKLDNDDWYVIPPDVQDDAKKMQAYRSAMQFAASQYKKMLDDGIKAEDARFVLPSAMKTTLVMKMNARELFNFLDLRLSPSAQWEIQEVAEAMFDAVWDYNDEWGAIMEIYQEHVQDIII